MKKRILYILLITTLAGIQACRKKTLLPDLRESYAYKETKPFGSNIAYRTLQNSFPDNYVQVKRLPFEDLAIAGADTNSIYCSITKQFKPTPEAADAIIDFVYKGNVFFLSAADIDTLFLHKLYCDQKPQNTFGWVVQPGFRNTSVKLVEALTEESKDSFSYFYVPSHTSFSELNDTYSRIAGYNDQGDPNFIIFYWGKGKFFLHTDPRAFSNYFLLTDSNYCYFKNMLELTIEQPEHVYWDDYYRTHTKNSKRPFSFFGEILRNPPLATAFWIVLAMLLLYILFGLKRKQRIIKTIPPNTNNSIAFTETIARLYLQQHDNKNIAGKMITYFNEYIRNRYFLHGNPGSDEFIEALSRKSGISLERTTSLYKEIHQLGKSEMVDDFQLLSLNEQIQYFYKNKS